MAFPAHTDVTQLLLAWSQGDEGALQRLIPVVYRELRQLAHRYMSRERPGHTLETTALIHEAYQRLVDTTHVHWQDRAHFFAVSSQLMRRILVDHARARRYQKRGGGARLVSLEEALVAPRERARDLVALDDALTALSAIDPRKGQVVELRFFGGLTAEETAEALKISPIRSYAIGNWQKFGSCVSSAEACAMTSERWRRIEQLYHEALECEPSKRGFYLEHACGSDHALRREIEGLLALEDQAEGFIEEPAVVIAAQDLVVAAPELTPGQTLDRYRILSLLGAGGMGMVYAARDSRLDRNVALKFLLPEFMGDPEALERIRREARALSALNHPNICNIYDIDEVEGRAFIVMECVAGKRLDRLIGRKGLKLKETLKYAVQIADALARAHSAGIIHRDLKPSNIMVDEHELVKVLDFGLAKLVERTGANEFAPTETIPLSDKPKTKEGMIVGTVAYMSPEQAEGKRLEARSDIFSFGSVLYEMITGRRAFQGETKVATLSAILHKDPEPLAELVAGVPPELERLLAHCLRKDPTRRLQHMDDVKVELEALKEESDSGRLAAPVFRGHGIPARTFLGVLLLVIATAGITWWLTRPHRQAAATALTRLTSDSGLTFQPALSPDGKLLAYASDRSGEGNLDIWVQQVGGGSPIRLTHDPADEYAPAFSPDGRAIAFQSNRGAGGIYLVPALGGDARLIAERGRRPRFSPDGAEIAYFVGDFFYSQIYLVSSGGGQPKQLQLGPDFRAANHPVWSPDGKRILFLGIQQTEEPDWWVASLTGDPPIKTGALAARGSISFVDYDLVPEVWQREKDFVLFAARSGDTTNVWRIPISPRTGKRSGEPEQVTSGAALEIYPSAAGDHLAFSSLSSQIDVWSLPVDANSGKVTGELQRLTDDAADDTRPAISQDGKKLVFLSNRSGNNDVWIKDLGSGKETPLTATPMPETRVKLSRDGLKVVYNQETSNRQYTMHVVGAQGGVPKNVCADCGTLLGVSPDGNRIIYAPGRGGLAMHHFVLDVEAGQKREILQSTSYGKYRPMFSPDGRWLTFSASVGSNPRKIFVAPLQAGIRSSESDWIAVTDASSVNGPDWSPDGNLIYFLSGQDGLLCIWAQRLDPITKHAVGPSFEVHHFASSRRSLNNLNNSDISLTVARDKLVFSMGERTGNIWMVKLEGN